MSDEPTNISDGQIRRLQNLKLYRDKSADEIREIIKERESVVKVTKSENKSYNNRFKEKLEILQSEYGIDMNNSNDPEMLSNLVRQMIQAENTDRDILLIQDKESKNKDDISMLKVYGDFQRDIQITIADLQDKLGISRKVRKEKAIDDIPQFIDGLLSRAKEFWADKTVAVECQKCKIELLRYWLNFPELTTKASFSTVCPHCHEKIEYVK